ncbi:hypothetical protein Syn7502_03138 [Synechococcus sp. PCC 7502]|uniref:type VII toxin-antitoxin system HepT family RNase toxin n=1 Tax=Synechococcus sp. PCC 7502 TaxID=1173263 RepID=UPI00029FA0E7|nr:HepT-like ribonuclease domain-containing protein [Synechococcus sp. PCC 7502]AFY75032.1 hypothetical protein Syn7502_03138 [Synechococcus sp. PCC 7502]
MSRVNPAIVMAKLAYMKQYLLDLIRFKDISLEDYLNSDNHYVVERLLQLIADVQTDVNRHLIKGLGGVQPRENAETAIVINSLGVIEIGLAQKMSASIGLRNVIVHLYDELNPEIVHGAISKTITDYAQYQRQILNYLDALEKNNDA